MVIILFFILFSLFFLFYSYLSLEGHATKKPKTTVGHTHTPIPSNFDFKAHHFLCFSVWDFWKNGVCTVNTDTFMHLFGSLTTILPAKAEEGHIFKLILGVNPSESSKWWRTAKTEMSFLYTLRFLMCLGQPRELFVTTHNELDIDSPHSGEHFKVLALAGSSTN